MVGWILLWALVVFAAVLGFRAARFVPPAVPEARPKPTGIDGARATEHLARMIRIPTVSSFEAERMDEAVFTRFRALLVELYPRVHAACAREEIGPRGVLYRLRGRSDENPMVLMSHYDVVPAQEDAWRLPAFEGRIEDGELWGRGTLDTKGTLCGILEAAEALLAEGFEPERDIYFAFSGDEEIMGGSAPAIVAELQRRGVQPGLVVDEGGAVVEGVFPGVNRACALVGIAEKGMMVAEMTLSSGGGHASFPPPHTSVGLLSRAVTRVEARPFPGKLTEPIRRMIDTLGRYAGFGYRLVFANLWCFFPLLSAVGKRIGGEINALIRTTCAFTMMEGSSAPNVLPPEARMGANLRLISGETPQTALEALRRKVNDDRIQVTDRFSMQPSNVSQASGWGWDRLSAAIRDTWPEAVVSPYLMFACSDSRHYDAISTHVYRFSAMALSKEERGRIHGNNERISVDKIRTICEFYYRLIRGS